MSRGDPETRKHILTATWRLMERKRGQGVRLEDVAKAAGISRQAVYLHFHSRAELLVATVRYVDQVNGVDEQLEKLRQAKGGLETLQAFLVFWGNYIPEIYGLAKALLAARVTDKAASAAWDDRMGALREGCRCIIDCLEAEQLLASEWSKMEAVDMLWGMLSVTLWEDLTIDRGWSQSQYLTHLQYAVQNTLVKQNA